MRLLRNVKTALRAIGHAVTGPRSSGPRARPAGARVHSGWIGPDGRVEEAPGTAVHVALLARFGEPTKAAFFAKGAVRYVDTTDHVSLELMGQHPAALGNAIAALTRRWAQMVDVDVELLPTSEILRASSADVRQAFGRRLRELQAGVGPGPGGVPPERAARDRESYGGIFYEPPYSIWQAAVGISILAIGRLLSRWIWGEWPEGAPRCPDRPPQRPEVSRYRPKRRCRR